jgi:hypothetical protein
VVEDGWGATGKGVLVGGHVGGREEEKGTKYTTQKGERGRRGLAGRSQV